MQSRQVQVSVLVGLILFGLTSCDNSPTNPAGVKAPQPPAATVVRRLRGSHLLPYWGSSGGFEGRLTVFTAYPSCRGPFPEAASKRVYTATVAQDDGRLTILVSGADLVVNEGRTGRFYGSVSVTGEIFFSIGGYYYPGDEIVERFTGNTALMVSGVGYGKGTPQLLSGTLEGSIRIANSPTPPFTVTADCSTTRFEMVRQQ